MFACSVENRRPGLATDSFIWRGRDGGLEGWDDLSFQSEKDDGGRRKSDAGPKAGLDAPAGGATAAGGSKKKRPDNPELGTALRTVYQRTIEEDIPPEMLDLLGKLG